MTAGRLSTALGGITIPCSLDHASVVHTASVGAIPCDLRLCEERSTGVGILRSSGVSRDIASSWRGVVRGGIEGISCEDIGSH